MPKDIWFVTREYAEVAEAGGIKNVVRSLAEEFAKNGWQVTVFIPFYGCTDTSCLTDFHHDCIPPVTLQIASQTFSVSFSCAKFCTIPNLRLIFIIHPSFSEKLGVYTYTESEELLNNTHICGTGHEDSIFLNTLFQKAIVSFGNHITGMNPPQIINCHDAATAMVPAFVNESRSLFFKDTKCVITIHNAGPAYHHSFETIDTALVYTGLPYNILYQALNGRSVEPFLIGCQFAHMTTVSPAYAEELLSPNSSNTGGLSAAFIKKGIGITGIINGIDYDRYDPADTEKSKLPYRFDPLHKDLTGKYKCRSYFLTIYSHTRTEKLQNGNMVKQYGVISDQQETKQENNVVYISFHGRIVPQKGIDVFTAAARNLMAKYDFVRFIVMGQGISELENSLIQTAGNFPGRFLYLKGYNRALSRLCTAVSDFIVLPSRFEPCGLEDFIAQIYGTIPVAHSVGGLKKIRDRTTGFLYTPDTAETLSSVLSDLVEQKKKNPAVFDKIIFDGAAEVKNKYSWSVVVRDFYMPLFKRLIGKI
jgi:starch synthase